MRGEKGMLKWMQQRKADRDKHVEDVAVSVLQKVGTLLNNAYVSA